MALKIGTILEVLNQGEEIKAFSDSVLAGEELIIQWIREAFKNDEVEKILKLVYELKNYGFSESHMSTPENPLTAGYVISLIKGYVARIEELFHIHFQNRDQGLNLLKGLQKSIVRITESLASFREILYTMPGIDFDLLRQSLHKSLSEGNHSTYSGLNIFFELPRNLKKSPIMEKIIDDRSYARGLEYCYRIRTYMIPLIPEITPELISELNELALPREGEKNYENEELITLFLEFSELAHREGLLALEDYLSDIRDPVLSKAITYVVDGCTPEFIFTNIRNTSREEVKALKKYGKMVSRGIEGIYMGDNPRLIGEAVASFLPPGFALSDEEYQSPEELADLEKKVETLPLLFQKLGEICRREGLFALEYYSGQMTNPLIRQGIQALLAGHYPGVATCLIEELTGRLCEDLTLYYNIIGHGSLLIQSDTGEGMIKVLLTDLLPGIPEKIEQTNPRPHTNFKDPLPWLSLLNRLSQLIRNYGLLEGQLQGYLHIIQSPADSTGFLSSVREALEGVLPYRTLPELSSFDLASAFLTNKNRKEESEQHKKSLLSEVNNKLNSFEEEVIQLERELKPSYGRLASLEQKENITAFLVKLGELYKQNREQYRNLREQIDAKTRAAVKNLSQELLGFTGELPGEESPELVLIRMILRQGAGEFAILKEMLPEEVFRRLSREILLFDKIEETEDLFLKVVVDQIDNDTLALALKGASDQILEKIYRTISVERKETLIEAMEYWMSPSEEEVLEARKKIMAFLDFSPENL